VLHVLVYVVKSVLTRTIITKYNLATSTRGTISNQRVMSYEHPLVIRLNRYLDILDVSM
jgi:hypothetical protein